MVMYVKTQIYVCVLKIIYYLSATVLLHDNIKLVIVQLLSLCVSNRLYVKTAEIFKLNCPCIICKHVSRKPDISDSCVTSKNIFVNINIFKNSNLRTRHCGLS